MDAFTSILLLVFALLGLLPTNPIVNADRKHSLGTSIDEDSCSQVIIAHCGASGYVPEHTLGSYALSVTMGADYVEFDLVMTSDKQLVARHDNELSTTTDIAHHPEFASRHRKQRVDGVEKEGWFTEDFTLDELKTLRVYERIPEIRPGNARMNGTFAIPTFQEIIDLIKSLQISQKRVIGIYPEIKHSSHFQRLGLPMELPLVEILLRNGYWSSRAPVYIQSFEVNNLKILSKLTNIKLIQLMERDKSAQPADQWELGTGLTYGEMATPEGLKEVAKYASAVGPDKSYIIPRDENNRLGIPTSFIANAHAAGLKVHAYNFRAENYFLPKEFQSNDSLPGSIGDFAGELRAYFDAGVDGLFCDQPDIALRVRGPCQKHSDEQ